MKKNKIDKPIPCGVRITFNIDQVKNLIRLRGKEGAIESLAGKFLQKSYARMVVENYIQAGI